MKYALLLYLYILMNTNSVKAQTQESPVMDKPFNQGYYELNFGAAYIESNFIFPGISFLVGKKFYLSKRILLDTEVGIALPSLGTGKIGVGYRNNISEITVGVRPWPTHYYLQIQLNSKEKGGWIFSFELTPFTFNQDYSSLAYDVTMGSTGMINFGYRWNFKTKD